MLTAWALLVSAAINVQKGTTQLWHSDSSWHSHYTMTWREADDHAQLRAPLLHAIHAAGHSRCWTVPAGLCHAYRETGAPPESPRCFYLETAMVIAALHFTPPGHGCDVLRKGPLGHGCRVWTRVQISHHRAHYICISTADRNGASMFLVCGLSLWPQPPLN